MNKLNLLKQLRISQIEREKWYENIPTDINLAFVDNEYVNKLQIINDLLISEVFGVHAELVLWFLYEFKDGYSIGEDGVEYIFENDDVFYEYFAKLKWEN